MKKLLFILSLLLVIGAESAFTQTIQNVRVPEGQQLFLRNPDFKTRVSAVQDGGIQTANNWDFLGIGSSVPDTIKTRSFIDSEGQTFGTYGNTDHVTGAWMLQSTWTKTFLPNLVTPDTVSIDAKFIGGEIAKVRRISMRIAVQYGDYNYAMLIDKTIPMDSQWVKLSWDMSFARSFGINFISRFYLLFQFYSNDSSLVGGDIVVRNLEGSTGGKINGIDFSIITAVPEPGRVPEEFILEQNYPNPFNPSTTIRFSVPKREQVNLSVYNSLGQEVRTLVSGEKAQGSYEVSFDASNLPSGIYFYKLQTGAKVEVKKMVLLK